MAAVQTVLLFAGIVIGGGAMVASIGHERRGSEGFHLWRRIYWVSVSVWAVLWAAAGSTWQMALLYFSLVLYIGILTAIFKTDYTPIPAFLKRVITQSRFWPKRRIASIDEILARPRDRNSVQRHTARED